MKAYDFGELLKALRIERGYSQKTLGSMIGVHESTIQKWEYNIAEPPWKRVKQLARLYGVSLDYIAGYDQSETLIISDLTKAQQATVIELIENLRSTNKKSGG